jgi:type III pantothenate kinase
MILAIDVGNTNIGMGLVEGMDVIGTFRLTTKTPRTSDEYGICISDLLISSAIDPHDIQDVIISSVVPSLMYSLTSSIIKYIGKEPIVIGPGTRTGIQIHTDNPREVGADRIVNVAMAYYTFKTSCIIIDFGTATTFDYVSKKGVFEYTVIAPGLGISAEALTSLTAKLPQVEILKPKSILCKNTIEGMQAGIVYGYIGQVEYIVRQMKKELKDPACKVIATGGLGRVIAHETSCIELYDPNVAYKGMAILYEKNLAGEKKKADSGR